MNQEIETKCSAGAESNILGLSTCRRLVAQMAKAKEAILEQFGGIVQSQRHLLELALNEADALAWQTGYPQLLFPTLAMEKAREVANWQSRQQALIHSRLPLAVAA